MPAKSSKGPMFVLSILIASLALSIGAIALIILFNKNRPTTEALVAACQAEVGGAISAEYGKVVEACQNAPKTPEIITVQGAEQYPSFSYPVGWTVYGQDRAAGSTIDNHILFHEGFVNICDGCDGPFFPIVVETTHKDSAAITAAGSFKQYLEKQYPKEQTDVTITEETLAGKPAIKVAGNVGGLGFDEVEYYYIDLGTKVLFVGKSISVEDSDTSSLDQAWQLLLSSLDVATIK